MKHSASQSTPQGSSIPTGESPTRILAQQHLLGTYGRFDLEIVRGEGCRVWDEHGKSFLDFGAGIAVCSLGHCHPVVTEAVVSQARQLVHTSNLYFTRPQALLAAELARLLGLEGRFFFCNSGAEANEGLIKISRRFGNATGGRHHIVSFTGSFHGRTMAGISATGQDKVKTGFAPLLEGFSHVPFGDINAVRAALRQETVAILVEPVQGEGGIHPATGDFLRALRGVADEHRLLLLYDEVQCGLGRTGDWCGWRSLTDEAEPDAVSWAKGIANGYPLGCFWITERAVGGLDTPLCDMLGPGSHGTTYGGNPVVCAAGLAVLREIEREDLPARAIEEGKFLADSLRALHSPDIREIRSIGLMIGIHLSGEFASNHPGEAPSPPSIQLAKMALRAGFLVIPAGENVVRLLPPLNVRREEICEAVRILASILTPPRTGE